MEEVVKTAEISEDGRYRWHLTRRWGEGKILPFIMLNPSTADAYQDDRTIGRCMSFARREGYSGIEVLNLFSFRTSSPDEMYRSYDPIGSETDSWLKAAARDGDTPVVCAWGGSADQSRVRDVVNLIGNTAQLVCLGTTKYGHPRHPLYVKSVQPLVAWSLPE